MYRQLSPIYTAQEVGGLVASIARSMEADYGQAARGGTQGPVLLIGALKGAHVFMADLVRAVQFDVEVDFVQTASYGRRDRPSTEVLITRDITSSIEGRDVVIVEGIVDRGHTAMALVDYLSSKGPGSLRFCSLLVRAGVEREVKVDYFGAVVGPGFVVGYGMDFKERFRGLDGIYTYKEEAT
ncbi:MAG: hypoxanthine phosphoribosyltransferase [Deltaproteobacteria bacterium]|nr:hypoxanthine phosphoribosyltransferase [Deltaproteobacteria bacterium]